MSPRVLAPASSGGRFSAWYDRQIARWNRTQAAAVADVDRRDVAAGEIPCEVWPRWLLPVELFGVVVLGAIALVEVGGAPVAVVLVLAALAVWMAWDIAAPGPAWLLGSLVLLPFAVLNVAGRELGLVASLGDDGPQVLLMLLVLFAMHVTVLTTSRLTVVALSAAILAIPVGRWLVEPTFQSAGVYVIGLSFGLIGGLLFGRQARLVFQLRAAQEALVDEATARERERIAREVHDVIAHTMAVTMLHVTAARLANERGQDDKVREALVDAERLGRESLNEVRRTVGLLRDGGGERATAAPLPIASDVAELIATHRDAGTALTARIDDAVDELSGAVGLAVYRLTQESLTNASKHAPGQPVELDLTVAAGEVTVRVTNRLPRRPPTSDGHRGMGLRGMAERVAQLEGSLTAGPSPDGRWVLTATLPLTPVPEVPA